MPAPDPAVVERQMYVAMHLNGVDDPSISLADLRYMGGGGVNAWRAAIASNAESASGGSSSITVTDLTNGYSSISITNSSGSTVTGTDLNNGYTLLALA